MSWNKSKPRCFYGWIVVACCFTCCFSYGIFYTLGIFFKTLQTEFGWSSTITSSIHSLHLLVFIPSTFLMGWLNDKYGPRLPIILGAVFFGVGFSLLSQVNNLNQFYLAYSIASLGGGIIWSVPLATVQKWFVKRSGLVLGIVTAGIGVATLVYAPLAEHLISSYGWRATYLQMGIGTAILLLLASLGIATPEKKGLQPYGAELSSQQGTTKQAITEVSWTRGEAMRTKTFWFVCALYFCTVLPIHMVVVHFVPFAQTIGIESNVAAWSWGLIGAVSIPGRIIIPVTSERTGIGWRKGLIITAIVVAASVFWLSKVTSLWMLLVFVVIYAFFYGGKVPLIPALIRSYFGTKYLGQIIGIIHAISLVGGAIGPLLAGYIVDVTGNYVLAFLICGSVWALAALFAWLSKTPKRINE